MGQKVIFLRKLVPGGAEHSFGIHVARMAGMPRDILRRAQEILKVLEAQSVEGRADTNAISPPLQLNMFDASDKQLEELRSEVKDLDLNAMTPIECMLKIAEWKKRLLEDS